MTTSVDGATPGTPHRWSTADYLRMWDAGVFDGPPELVDGRLLEVRVDPWRLATRSRLLRKATTLALDPSTAPLPAGRSITVPDLALRRPGAPHGDELARGIRRVRPSDVLLVVEVADEIRDYVLTTKARVYAQAGFPQLWVVTPDGVFVHDDPIAEGYVRRVLHPRHGRIRLPFAPGTEWAVQDLIDV